MEVSASRYQLDSDINVAEPLSGLQVAAEDDCAAHPCQKAIIGVQERDSFEKFGKQAIGSRPMQSLRRRRTPEANTFVSEAPLPSAARESRSEAHRLYKTVCPQTGNQALRVLLRQLQLFPNEIQCKGTFQTGTSERAANPR
jgi:hypothetical protein